MSLDGRQARVLLVDDDPGSRMLLQAVLEGPDRELIEAENGQKALDLLNDPANAFNCAAILLDIHMPVMDGFQTAERLKENEATAAIPIIFLTGTAGSSQLFRGYEMGAVDYMMKPFDQGVLRSKVDVFIDLWEKNQELQELTELRRQHEVERVRRESEERYRTLANAMPQMAWLADAAGKTTFLNERWFEYVGDAIELGAEFDAFIHPDDQPQASARWQEARDRGRVFEAEYRVLRSRDQSWRWHLARALPIKEDNGQLSGWVGTLTDIEDQKTIAAELEAQYAVARALVASETLAEAAPDLLEALGTRLGWEIACWWGRSDELVCRHSWHSPQRSELDCQSLSQAAVDGGDSLVGQVFVSGQTHWSPAVSDEAQFRRREALPLPDLRGWVAFPVTAHNEVVAVIEMFKSDSRPPDRPLLETLSAIGSQIGQFIERVDAELELRESEELKGSILYSAMDAIVTMDHEGRISEFNPAAEAIFGYGRDEALGCPLAELLIPPEYREAHWRGLKRYLESGQARILNRRLELPALRKDGSRFDAELTITRVDMPGPPLFTAYLRDITERKQAESRILEAEERYRTLVEQLPLATYTVDDAGRITYISPQIEAISGASPQETVGAEVFWAERLHPDDRERVPAAWRAWRGGDLAQPFRMEYRLRREDGSYLWVADAAVPIHGSDGEVAYFQGYIVDIDERKRAERELALLAQAGELLARSLEYEQTLDSVAHLLVPDFADWCVVYLLEDSGRLEPIVIAHEDEEKEIWAREFAARYPSEISGEGVGAVVRSGEPALVPEISDEMITQAGAGDAERLLQIKQIGMRSYLCVPMTAHGRVIGAIALIISDSPQRYGQPDLEVAAELARRAGLAIDNARLYQDRNDVARTLERSLLPPSLPRVPGVDVAARYHPATAGSPIGGDFYDLFQLDDGSWLAVIGDVVGKGAEAAALTGLARHTLRAAAMRDSDPVEMLKMLNEAIERGASEGQFCTVAVVKLEPQPGAEGLKALVADAGHPLPLLLRASGTVEKIDARGIPLGMWPEADIDSVAVELGEGDKLILYTDGVLEARFEGELYGDERLLAFLAEHGQQSAPELAAALEHEVVDFQQGGVHDDIAILVVEPTNEREGPSLSVLSSEPRGSQLPRVDLRLDPDARSVALARHAIDDLSEALDEEALAQAHLLVSEVVSNAVKYSFSDEGSYVGFAVEVEQGRLHVEVSDGGLGFPEEGVDLASLDAESGRGLFLVDALSARWGVRRGERNVVWFEIDLGEI